jgi:predicted flap endonuclease-1-like 5' DNA nuclease
MANGSRRLGLRLLLVLAGLALGLWLLSQAVRRTRAALRALPSGRPLAVEVRSPVEPSLPADPPQPVERPLPAEAAQPAAEDDLTRIKGIGPVTASKLRQLGITTFAKLAAADPDELRRAMQAAERFTGNPAAWQEQARRLAR